MPDHLKHAHPFFAPLNWDPKQDDVDDEDGVSSADDGSDDEGVLADRPRQLIIPDDALLRPAAFHARFTAAGSKKTTTPVDALAVPVYGCKKRFLVVRFIHALRIPVHYAISYWISVPVARVGDNNIFSRKGDSGPIVRLRQWRRIRSSRSYETPRMTAQEAVQ